DAVSKIRGPKGSKVILEITRAGLNTPMNITVVRDEIPIITVYSSVIDQGGKKIGKIEITQFSTETANDFKKQLAELEGKGIQGLIVDVRGNPGGLLNSVINIANDLVPKGGTIVKIEYSDGKKESFASENRNGKYPIVVLADKGSASAAEILAAAMKENGSKVIGTSTFGKGTVQNTQNLSDQSQLKLTIAKWLTPDGNWIHKKGLAPSITVEQPSYFKAVSLPANKTLQKEMNGTEVQNLQLILNGLGYNPGRTDGYFDTGTETAVKNFQGKMKLEQTGKVEGKTAELLQTELLNKMKDPKNDAQLQKAIEVMVDLVK
ncbi:MAG TPA: peptidase S41, partial [Paenibacillaceae bacterium]|nr:peptidase S41 [Paenibacillaceae bacterium]